MTCTACRREVEFGEKFCKHCGARIAESSGERPAFEKKKEEPLVRTREVAQLVGCSEQKIRRMAEDGEIPAVAFPVGLHRKTWRFRMSAVQRWLDEIEADSPSGRRMSKRTARNRQ